MRCYGVIRVLLMLGVRKTKLKRAWEDLREPSIMAFIWVIEVKQSEFNDIMGYHPETKYIGNNLPALNVSWAKQ